MLEGLKRAFINSDENTNETPKQEPVKETGKTKFPSSQSNQPETQTTSWNFGIGKTNPAPSVQTTTPSTTTAAPEHIAKAMDAYQQGLVGIKQAGYDFLNFYDALSDDDKKNPSVYQMAVRFAVSMDKSVTKDKLVQSADFYIDKIKENYQNYINSGNTKKQAVLKQKSDENHNLTSELENLELQAQAIQTQIADRKNKIASIDSKYAAQLTEIDSKLAANDIAKDQIVGSLEAVKQGIINNVK